MPEHLGVKAHLHPLGSVAFFGCEQLCRETEPHVGENVVSRDSVTVGISSAKIEECVGFTGIRSFEKFINGWECFTL